MSEQIVDLRIDDRIAFITMQDSEHFNCLSEQMCGELISAIKRQFRILSRAASTMSSESFERINAYRTKVYRGEDYKEGIKALIEKRNPQYQGKASDLDE